MIYIADKLKAYKLRIEDGKVFDPIRGKFVPLTPEEDVRQRMIRYMIQEMKVSSDRIVVERMLSGFGVRGSRKRIDIGVLGKDGRLEAVIECKAYSIRFSEAPFQQAIDYVRALKVKGGFISSYTRIFVRIFGEYSILPYLEYAASTAL